jgi:hypothetical protein
MAGDFLGTYDPKEVSLDFAGVTISGFFDDTFITCAKADPELYKKHIGAHGEVARTKNNNDSGTITFVLKKTSPSNLQLDLLKRNPATAAVMVKNNSNHKHIATASEAWIDNDPEITYSNEEDSIEWIIGCSNLIMSHLPN